MKSVSNSVVIAWRESNGYAQTKRLPSYAAYGLGEYLVAHCCCSPVSITGIGINGKPWTDTLITTSLGAWRRTPEEAA